MPLVNADLCLLTNRSPVIRFQVSGVRCQVSGVSNKEDLESYKKLCRLHIEWIGENIGA
jgi:hypothetical protein